jgi:hypothetical protein
LAVENVGTDVKRGAAGTSFAICCAPHWPASAKDSAESIVADMLVIFITPSPKFSA